MQTPRRSLRPIDLRLRRAMSFASLSQLRHAARVMLTLSLWAYIIGNLAGRLALATPFWVLLAIGLSRFRHPPKISRAVFAALAFRWGQLHGAPSAGLFLDDVTVVAINGAYPGSGPIIVETPSGDRYETYGAQRLGVRGSVEPEPSPRLFAASSSHFVRLGASSSSSALPSALARAGAILRDAFSARVLSLDRGLRPWLKSIIIGDKTGLDPAIESAFRQTGIYHLLVVSGQHVSLIAFLLAFLIRMPLTFAYALRAIKPTHWPHAASALDVASAVTGLAYAAATGMPVASQRAAILFATFYLSRVFYGAPPLVFRLKLAAFLQCAFFPIGILSEASLMSWGAFLVVLVPASLVRLQLVLTVLTIAIFGQFAPLALAANVLFIPLFSFTLTIAILASILPAPDLVLPFAFEIQRTFLLFLSGFAGLCDRFPVLAPPKTPIPPLLRVAFLGLGYVLLLNRARDLTIRPAED